jgi:FAD/FMN-containing dehydrogenase
MKRRDFVRVAGAAAALAPFHRILASTAASTAPATDLPARMLDGRETSLARTDLEALGQSMRGDLVLPGQPQYDEARKVWNGMFNTRRPAAIARVSGVADVRLAVHFAREHQLLTAVRSGAHSATGKSTCDGGLVIDLAPMNGVRVDPAGRVAYVETGALLGAIDHETTSMGLVTTAGTVSHTGCGGLTLGGGLGRVGRRFGLACDNLRAVEIVTPDGQLRRASATENPDLFWGLRGGGGNFGVATLFEYQLHPMNPTILGGYVAWPAVQARDVLRFYGEFVARAPDALNLEPVLVAPPGAPPMLLMEACWSGDHAEGERVLEPVRRFGKPMRDSIRPMPYVALQRANDAANPPGIRHYGKAGFVRRVEPGLTDGIVEAFLATPRDFVVLFQLAGGEVGRVPADATAFVNRDAACWIMILAHWKDAAEDDGRRASARTAWKRIEPYTSGFYTNSLTEEDDARERIVYGANYDRLVQVKTKYDPGNLFRLNANVKPARA